VWWLGWDVLGVAFGTTLAEYVAAVSGIAIALWHLRRIGGRWTLGRILAPARLKRVCFVNGDIMIRSLALMTVFVWFTSQGARQGDAILAGNSILMQFIASCAFFLDGLAFAAEALVGRAVGASQREGLKPRPVAPREPTSRGRRPLRCWVFGLTSSTASSSAPRARRI
jgi:MATE family multidrug resistance protein